MSIQFVILSWFYLEWCSIITFSVIIADEDSHDPAPDSGEHSEPNTEEVKTVDLKTEADEGPTPAEGDKISTDAKQEPSPTSEPQTIPKDERPATPPPTSGATSSD